MIIYNSPLVSIIVPSLNRKDFLKKALDSILDQTYTNIEIVVIDGASQDGTVDLLKSYGGKIIWVSEKDKSLTEALNKGIEKATGKYFMTLATDETLFSESISVFVREAEKSKKDIIIIGQGFYADENGNILEEINNPKIVTFEGILTLKYKLPLAFSFFSMSLVAEYKFDEDFIVCQDFMFWLVTKNVEKIFIDTRVGTFGKHEHSWSWNPKNAKKLLQARFLAYKKFFDTHVEYSYLKKRSYIGAYLDYFELIHRASFFSAYFVVLRCLLLSLKETVSVIEERGYEGAIFNVLRKYGTSLS